MSTRKEACPGCGGRFVAVEGPIHAYLTSSPACWAAYGEILAREYSDPLLMPTHRLSVDTYAVQHPGDNGRRPRQSVTLHLARLCMQLSTPMPPKETNDVMVRLKGHERGLPTLESPPPVFTMTVADVTPLLALEAHSAVMRRWAQATWDDWRAAHATIKHWITSLDP